MRLHSASSRAPSKYTAHIVQFLRMDHMLGLKLCVTFFCLSISASATAQPLVAVSYKGPANSVLHEPVVVEFSIENVLTESIDLDFGLDRKENFVIAIRQPDGSLVQAPPLPIHDGLNRIGRVSIMAGDRYEQKLVLNEWYSFDQSGPYEVTIQLRTRIVTQRRARVDAPTTGVLTFRISPRNDEQLHRACQRLAEVTVSASDAGDRIDAADALSYVHDPVGVSWMQWVLGRTDSVDPIMIRGLTRIGDTAAEAVLAELTASPDPERSRQADTALRRLRANAR
jgi:hypothetical protein